MQRLSGAASEWASFLICQADEDGDGRVSVCCVVLFMLVFNNHVRMLGLYCLC